MTPSRRTLERFASFLLAAILFMAILLAASATDPARAATPRTPHETIAYVPGAIWGDYLPSAAGELGLDPFAIYWFDGADAMGRPIGDRERYEAKDAKAAPREALVAFVGKYAAYPANELSPGVAVMDTTGALIADFPRGTGYAWSPDGARLAVLFSKEPLPRARGRRGRVSTGIRYRPGVSIWDRRDGSVRTYSQWPSRAAWAGDDSLLLQLPGQVLALDARRGTIAPTQHRGTILSPDARYAIWPGEGGENTKIFDDPVGVQMESDLFGPFQKSELGQIRSAFWVRGRGADHLMVVSACNGIQYPRPSCRTEVIDVETRETVDFFSGEALGPTADGRGVVVFRRSRGRLEFHDLRPVVREYAREPSPEPSGEFH